jgi:malonate transporter and related proteins
MLDVLNLALPFFGLILLGLVCGRLNRIPESGLAWMNFFIVYLALPALFYRILAQTPLEQLTQARFIIATTLSTFSIFVIAFAIAMLARRRRPGDKLPEATIAALAGSYGNVGYMGGSESA